MKKWTPDQVIDAMDKVSQLIESPYTEDARQRDIAREKEVLTKAGWTWNEYMDELERRLDIKEYNVCIHI